MFRLYLKITLFLLVANVYAQLKLPPVVNFSVEDYKGGNQNWGVDTSGQIIYVANNEGLLEFDGVNWYLNRLPNRTIVRSVKVVDNKIYTGSYEEFGFWERTKDGSLEYTSLSKELNQGDIASQSIWDIYEFNNKIVFKSFGILYVYDFKDVKVVKPYGILLAASVIDNRFFVHGKDKGLLELVNDELVLVPGTEKLGDEKVEAIIPYNGKLLLGTSLNGCYTYINGILEKWNNVLDSQLKENQLNTLSYSNGNIYFGTIKNGVYQYDVKNDSYINLNVKNGLQNNTVLASLIDNKGNLWLALDNGISAVPLEHYSYYLNPYKADIGAVYDIADLNGEIFVATNTGIYKMLDKGVEFIEGSQGHTWSLTVVDNEIICGHNSGTFSIKNGKLITVEQRNGGYVFKKIPGKTDKYIQTNYSGLTFYEKVNGNWSSYYVADISLPIKNIVFEKDHTAWVVHAYKGIYKIFFADDYKSVTKIEGKYNKEFQNLYDIKIFEVEGNVAFFNNENWYVYNPLEDNIEEFSSLRKV
ncbi:MAG: response regulator, partial [Flavobacteriaceae bacterium]|nr:response regulator [Flavobacteriaceae bacterium]